MSDLSVALESIRACFAGVMPTQFATCSPDGTPNVIAVSLVHYVEDAEERGVGSVTVALAES